MGFGGPQDFGLQCMRVQSIWGGLWGLGFHRVGGCSVWGSITFGAVTLEGLGVQHLAVCGVWMCRGLAGHRISGPQHWDSVGFGRAVVCEAAVFAGGIHKVWGAAGVGGLWGFGLQQ